MSFIVFISIKSERFAVRRELTWFYLQTKHFNSFTPHQYRSNISKLNCTHSLEIDAILRYPRSYCDKFIFKVPLTIWPFMVESVPFAKASN